MNFKIKFIKRKLNYFIYCLDLKKKENIILQSSLEELEKKLVYLCYKYQLWKYGDLYEEIEEEIQEQLSKSINLFENNDDNEELDAEIDEFHRFIFAQFNYLEYFYGKNNQ